MAEADEQQVGGQQSSGSEQTEKQKRVRIKREDVPWVEFFIELFSEVTRLQGKIVGTGRGRKTSLSIVKLAKWVNNDDKLYRLFIRACSNNDPRRELKCRKIMLFIIRNKLLKYYRSRVEPCYTYVNHALEKGYIELKTLRKAVEEAKKLLREAVKK